MLRMRAQGTHLPGAAARVPAGSPGCWGPQGLRGDRHSGMLFFPSRFPGQGSKSALQKAFVCCCACRSQDGHPCPHSQVLLHREQGSLFLPREAISSLPTFPAPLPWALELSGKASLPRSILHSPAVSLPLAVSPPALPCEDMGVAQVTPAWPWPCRALGCLCKGHPPRAARPCLPQLRAQPCCPGSRGTLGSCTQGSQTLLVTPEVSPVSLGGQSSLTGTRGPGLPVPAVSLGERATRKRLHVGKEGAQLPRGDVQLLAQGRCKAPQIYSLRRGYFGKGQGRSCDWSWGLRVWAAGSCLSDSDPLPDPGKPESPRWAGDGFHTLSRLVPG